MNDDLKQALKNIRVTDFPPEFISLVIYQSLMANPEVRNRSSDDATIARLAFKAAVAFGEVAEMEVKKRGERS